MISGAKIVYSKEKSKFPSKKFDYLQHFPYFCKIIPITKETSF